MATNSTTQRSSNVLRGVRQGVVSTVDDQKNRAADGLVNMAEAVKRLAEEIGGQNRVVNSAVNVATQRLHQVADGLRHRQSADIANEIARVAREHPWLFVGGAFVLGVGLAQVLKSGGES
jgi:hypothetical protein